MLNPYERAIVFESIETISTAVALLDAQLQELAELVNRTLAEHEAAGAALAQARADGNIS